LGVFLARFQGLMRVKVLQDLRNDAVACGLNFF